MMWIEELVDLLNEYPNDATVHLTDDGCFEVVSDSGEHLDSIKLDRGA